MCMFGGGPAPAGATSGTPRQAGVPTPQQGAAPGVAAQNPFQPTANDANMNAQTKVARKTPTVLGRSDNAPPSTPQKTALGG